MLPPHIHAFERKGSRFIFNGDTLLLIRASELSYTVCCMLLAGVSPVAVAEQLKPRYGERELRESINAAGKLLATGCFREHPDSFVDAATQPNVLAFAVLGFSERCNLACSYCFVRSAGAMTGRVMPLAVAKQAVSFLLSDRFQVTRPFGISFFGGEPLLNYRHLDAVVGYAQDLASARQVALSLFMTTNGTVLNKNVIDVLRERRIGLLVSVDGPRRLHDKQRPRPSGNGSHRVVEKHLRTLRDHGIPFEIRATVTNHEQDFRELAEYFLSLGATRFSIEYMEPSAEQPYGFGGHSVATVNQRMSEFTDYYVSTASRRPFSLFYLDGTLRALHRRSGNGGYPCGASYGTLYIDVDGHVWPCAHFQGVERFRLGSIYGETELEHTVVARFRECSVAGNPTCRRCWAKYLCGGQCHSLKYFGAGSLDDVVQEECAIRRHRFEETMWVYSRLLADAPALLDAISNQTPIEPKAPAESVETSPRSTCP